MTRSLIGLPIRLGLRGAGMALHGVAALADHALGLIGRVAGAATPAGASDVDLDGSPPEKRQRGTERRGERRSGQRTQTRRRPARATVDTEAPGTPEPPAHVSEEPTLVEAVAEAGAEEGAGAEVHVAEPWEGYRELSADDVIDRITGASTAELAAVELYERAHRQRQTVLVAVEKELRRASAQPGTRGGGGAPSQGASGEPQ